MSKKTPKKSVTSCYFATNRVEAHKWDLMSFLNSRLMNPERKTTMTAPATTVSTLKPVVTCPVSYSGLNPSKFKPKLANNLNKLVHLSYISSKNLGSLKQELRTLSNLNTTSESSLQNRNIHFVNFIEIC